MHFTKIKKKGHWWIRPSERINRIYWVINQWRKRSVDDPVRINCSLVQIIKFCNSKKKQPWRVQRHEKQALDLEECW